jgi:hypothetical protein
MNARRCSVCTSTNGHQSANTFSHSVCSFLSRPILRSVCSVCLGAITPLVSHRLRLHETVLVCTSTHGHQKHQHILKVGLFVLKSANPWLYSSGPSHLLGPNSPPVTRDGARCVRVRMVIEAPTHSQIRSVCSYVGQSAHRSVLYYSGPSHILYLITSSHTRRCWCVRVRMVIRCVRAAWSSRHQHSLKVGLCILKSANP